MGSRKVIQTYYADVNNLTDLLSKLTNSYRLLIGSADELNKIALSKKKAVRDALKRADKLGDIIDEVIDILEVSSVPYAEYCNIKSDIIKAKIDANYIFTEIEEDINFKE